MKYNTRRLAYAVLIGLAAICAYLALIPPYVDCVSGGGTQPADPRLQARESMIKRGDILDRHGEVLACSLPAERGYQRCYPLGNAAAHVTGYCSQQYGSAGLEKSMAPVLLGLRDEDVLRNLRNRILGRPASGRDIMLTIDAGLQAHAARLLQGHVGAAVVLNPATGEVLALASYPAYDPAVPGKYIDGRKAPLLNRACQGAYPPGSVFKIVTAAAVLAHEPRAAEQTVHCTGELVINGFVLRDNAAHGLVDFYEAFAASCNVAFARYGLALGAEKLVQQARACGIGKRPEFPLPVYAGHIPPAGAMDGPALASTAIGQGEVLLSPLHAALLACAVANEGLVMKPYIVAGYENPYGRFSRRHPEKWLRAMDPAVAAVIKQQMVAAVAGGTGRAAALPGVAVAGKTGSAENPHGPPHAWFVGFAPAERPRVAVAVLLENAGSGGRQAAPLAREIFRKALQP